MHIFSIFSSFNRNFSNIYSFYLKHTDYKTTFTLKSRVNIPGSGVKHLKRGTDSEVKRQVVEWALRRLLMRASRKVKKILLGARGNICNGANSGNVVMPDLSQKAEK